MAARMQCESPLQPFCLCYLCSASVGTNSGNLPPTWPLPAQQVVPVGVRTLVVAARTKVGEGNGWKKGSTDEKSITMLVYQSVLYMCSNM
ncbi:hypothetical protein E2C01_001154 [Portunus trituberculatus]|uniref:Uncharacterized protein n=1 Tax=Portunus trituberculatus TaxID=210409 RepID=A0A5B7CJQ6_PORTR|nr:hypothetical protein [Portunus trituberculatus]